MLGQAFGLYSHMRNNRIRSWFLLAGLFGLSFSASFGAMLVFYGFSGSGRVSLGDVTGQFLAFSPLIALGTLAWIGIGYQFNVGIINAATGASGITRDNNPRIYRLLENLCISRGLTMPKLAIVESDALNAFASGVNEKQFTVTVTTGLLAQLNDAEIEAVLAHELTHIRNGDVKLMVIAIVIAGVISLVGELVFRMFANGPRFRSSGSSSSGDRKGAGAMILIGFAIIAVSWLLAVLVRLSLSRSREYLADAGAVELTKNPDAMISALLKISGRADIEGVPSGVMDMCFENDPDDMADLFSTHPSIIKRVQALIDTAGGKMPPQPPSVGMRNDLPTIVESRGPWGASVQELR
jgi:heat shock protein HtpX